MTAIWDDAFGYIAKGNIAPLFVGEFGISSMSSYEGKAGTWFKTFVKYIVDNFLSWTFWALNPNSGDTGGLLDNDWVSVVQWKLDQIKPMCAPLINDPMGVTEATVSPVLKHGKVRVKNGIVRVDAGWKSGGRLELVDCHGRVVRSANEASLALGNLAAGIYFANVVIDDRVGPSVRIAVQ